MITVIWQAAKLLGTAALSAAAGISTLLPSHYNNSRHHPFPLSTAPSIQCSPSSISFPTVHSRHPPPSPSAAASLPVAGCDARS
eukprot:9503767-Pyramimonas_sp.AAC.1